jgi:hypothetical protein
MKSTKKESSKKILKTDEIQIHTEGLVVDTDRKGDRQ